MGDMSLSTSEKLFNVGIIKRGSMTSNIYLKERKKKHISGLSLRYLLRYRKEYWSQKVGREAMWRFVRIVNISTIG